MGEESAEIGDDALRRVGPAANGEATQFREQGGGLRATARGAGVGLVGRHVRSVGIGLVLVLVLLLLLVPAPGHSKPRARDYVKERAVIDRHTLTPTHKNTDTLPDATARPLRSLAWIFLYRLQIDSLVHKKYDFDLVELWSSAAPGSSYYFLYFFSRRRAARLRRNSSSVRSVVRAGAKVTSVWRWFAQWKRPELVAFVGIQPGRPSSPPCVFPGRRTTAHAPAPPPGIRPIGWQSCPAVAFPSAFPGPLLSPS